MESFTIASRGGLRSGGRPGLGAEAGREGGRARMRGGGVPGPGARQWTRREEAIASPQGNCIRVASPQGHCQMEMPICMLCNPSLSFPVQDKAGLPGAPPSGTSLRQPPTSPSQCPAVDVPKPTTIATIIGFIGGSAGKACAGRLAVTAVTRRHPPFARP